jgi:hypothetical protein
LVLSGWRWFFTGVQQGCVASCIHGKAQIPLRYDGKKLVCNLHFRRRA